MTLSNREHHKIWKNMPSEKSEIAQSHGNDMWTTHSLSGNKPGTKSTLFWVIYSGTFTIISKPNIHIQNLWNLFFVNLPQISLRNTAHYNNRQTNRIGWSRRIGLIDPCSNISSHINSLASVLWTDQTSKKGR